MTLRGSCDGCPSDIDIDIDHLDVMYYDIS